jgi:hypothetical protein
MPPSGLSDEDMMRIDPDFKVFVSRTILALLNYVFTGLFTVELVVRVCSRGLYFTERAYLKDGWNVMDALIVGFSWVEVIFELSGSQLSGEVGKVLRLARALRPLRKLLQPPPSLIWYVFVDSDYRWFLALEGKQKGTRKFQSTVISCTRLAFIGTTDPVDSWMLTTLRPVMDILSVVVVQITLISFPFITLCH